MDVQRDVKESMWRGKPKLMYTCIYLGRQTRGIRSMGDEVAGLRELNRLGWGKGEEEERKT